MDARFIVERLGRWLSVRHSIFALELCLRLEPTLRASLRSRIASHPAATSFQDKWALYTGASREVLSCLALAERGCWDYFDDDARARRDYKMWCDGMITKEGVRPGPSGASDPYREEPRYMTFTMSFLLVQGTATDVAVASLCNVRQDYLWHRETFARILAGIGAVSFASVKSDVIYVIPGSDDGWALTAEDLAADKFSYLRPLVSGGQNQESHTPSSTSAR